MIVTLEHSPPFRWKGKVERYGDFRRFIWGWWAVAFFPCADFNDLLRAFREVAVEEVLEEMNLDPNTSMERNHGGTAETQEPAEDCVAQRKQ